ncbi:MAG TPA: isoamylase early set domain-containing protein [Longimicrobiales bacterium]|nr:isoamylase early set domain-containing protein [Longimicrobiales bacterium]
MADHEDTLARAVETLKEPVHIDPGVARRIMAAIEQLPRPAARGFDTRSALAWLRRGYTLRLTPLGGLAAAAGLAALLFAGGRVLAPRAAPLPGMGAESHQLTQFVLVAPEAASVAVIGDFNDWSFSATPLARHTGDGVWWVTVPLAPGRYRYAFVVDGAIWRPDPNAPSAEDEFGRPNSVVTIGG